MWPHVVVEGQVGQPVATLVREVGLGAATVAGDMGMEAATEGMGEPTGSPQSSPPAGERGLLPPALALLPEAGCAEKISPGVSPSSERRAIGEEPSGMGGPGGRAPGQEVKMFCQGFPHRIVSVWGDLRNFL